MTLEFGLQNDLVFKLVPTKERHDTSLECISASLFVVKGVGDFSTQTVCGTKGYSSRLLLLNGGMESSEYEVECGERKALLVTWTEI